MYCEGNGVEAIGRLLDVSTGTIYAWIRKGRAMHEGDVDSSQATSDVIAETPGVRYLSGRDVDISGRATRPISEYAVGVDRGGGMAGRLALGELRSR
jgi:transposase-like protein